MIIPNIFKIKWILKKKEKLEAKNKILGLWINFSIQNVFQGICSQG